jgi:parallel beta-helix repeat protein
MSKKNKLFGVLLVSIALLGLLSVMTINPRLFFDRESIKNSPILLQLRNVKLSLIKFTDIIHLPYWFKKTNLETYYLSIDRQDMGKLNFHLPKDIYDGKLKEDNKFWVNGYFKAPGYEAKVDVRYRGYGSNHWNALQRSYLVKFPNDNLYKGMKSMALIIAYDRGYYAEMLDNYRAKKLGLITPEFWFTRVNLNGQDNGVYLAVEQWSPQWLAKAGLQDNFEIFSTNKDGDPESLNMYSLKGQSSWKNYNIGTDFEPLRNLARLIENSDEKTFAKYIPNLVDMEKFYRWSLINLLAGSSHQSDESAVLVFNRVTGKFEPVAWDVHLYKIVDTYFQDFDTLSRRILSIQQFYSEFRKLALGYVNDPKNIEDDLGFYDQLDEKMKSEFYSDQAKFHNDVTYRRLVKKYRNSAEVNFSIIPTILTDKTPVFPLASKSNGQIFSGSFLNILQVDQTPTEFIKRNPQFVLKGNEIVLTAGNHYFDSNVIIPKNTALTIEPGAQNFMAKGVSIISYSPIVARGTKESPIKFLPAKKSDHWGAFAVVNVPEASYFSHVTFDGGTLSDEINGVVFTGMFSAHNSNVSVIACNFINDGDDDSVNFKYSKGQIIYSYFGDNNGDALDLDESSEVPVTNNTFINNGYGLLPNGAVNNNGGDAIDVSFNHSKIEGNVVRGCGDKGISIGENSTPVVANNIVIGCVYGIAVKDGSRAILENNILLSNRVGIGLYQKKPEFSGGVLQGENLVVWGNGQDFEKDAKSSFDIKNSVIEKGIEGENISTSKPDFNKLLPAYLLNSIKNLLP